MGAWRAADARRQPRRAGRLCLCLCWLACALPSACACSRPWSSAAPTKPSSSTRRQSPRSSNAHTTPTRVCVRARARRNQDTIAPRAAAVVAVADVEPWGRPGSAQADGVRAWQVLQYDPEQAEVKAQYKRLKNMVKMLDQVGRAGPAWGRSHHSHRVRLGLF